MIPDPNETGIIRDIELRMRGPVGAYAQLSEWNGFKLDPRVSSIPGIFTVDRFAPLSEGDAIASAPEPTPNHGDGYAEFKALNARRATAVENYFREFSPTPSVVLDGLQKAGPMIFDIAKESLCAGMTNAGIDLGNAWTEPEEELSAKEAEFREAATQVSSDEEARTAKIIAEIYATIRLMRFDIAWIKGYFPFELALLDMENPTLHNEALRVLAGTETRMLSVPRGFAPPNVYPNKLHRALYGIDPEGRKDLEEKGIAYIAEEKRGKKELTTTITIMDPLVTDTAEDGTQFSFLRRALPPEASAVYSAALSLFDAALCAEGRYLGPQGLSRLMEQLKNAPPITVDIPLAQLARQLYGVPRPTEKQCSEIKAVLRGLSTVWAQIDCKPYLKANGTEELPREKWFEGPLLSCTFLGESYGNVRKETLRISGIPPQYAYAYYTGRMVRLPYDLIAARAAEEASGKALRSNQTPRTLAVGDYLLLQIVTMYRMGKAFPIDFVPLLDYLGVPVTSSAPRDKTARKNVRDTALKYLQRWKETGFIRNYAYTGKQRTPINKAAFTIGLAANSIDSLLAVLELPAP